MSRNSSSKWLLAGMMILVFAFVGCSSDDDDGGTKPPPPTNGFTLMSPYTDAYLSTYVTPNDGLGINITAQMLYDANLGNDDPADDYFIVDWRSSTDFANAHIEGAVNYAMGDIIAHVDAGDFPTDQPVCNVCYTGQTASTMTAILNLLGQDMGFDAVNLKFGMSGWTSETDYVGKSYPTSDDYDSWMTTNNFAKPAAGDYPNWEASGTALEILKARANAYVHGEYNEHGSKWNMVSIGDIYDDINDGVGPYIVNYFPDANYNAGHVPTAVQYVPKASLQTDNTLNTLPVDDEIVVYCYTGQTSAQVTACLNILGYHAYSLLFGVQGLCHSNATINPHPYNPPNTDYPCVGTGVGSVAMR